MKKFLKIFSISLILLLVGLYFLAKWMYAPTYDGELELSNLKKKVTVIYDKNGIPHIEAQNQQDAYRALGYVHAQDRLWQMELMRRITAGRLSEIFGKDFVKIDKFMLSLMIGDKAHKTIMNLDKNSEPYKLTQAYLDGINQFIDKGATPVEFHLLGIDKQKYTIEDVYSVFGYIAFSFAYAYKFDPLITEIHEKLGSKYVEELMIPKENLTIIKGTNKKVQAKFSGEVNQLLEKLPVPLLEGSNSWVLGAERTKNGKVIFENDPHIEFSQPAVWYQSHIKTPDYEMYGFNLALTPFCLLGHNRDLAYGLTMFENDDIDFYIEQNNPDNPLEYKTENGYEPYKVYDKVIKVKDGEDVHYKIKVTRHGAIMNDALDNLRTEKPIAMQWIYTKLKNNTLEASYHLSHLKSMEDLHNFGSMIHAPGLNLMYGDAKGNIAMYGVAKLYKYRDSLSRKMFLDGASGKDEIKEYLDFKENIWAENPKSNFVYSANNQHDTIAGILYPGYYLAQDRAKRITDLIGHKYDFDKEGVKEMALDVTSAVAPDIIKNASKNIDKTSLSEEQKYALEILEKWDGAYKQELVAPTIYTRFIYEFHKNTFADEMGEGFKQFLEIPLEHHMRAVQMNKTESVWWDNINTKDVVETKGQIVTQSFKKAVDFLKKQLGNNPEKWTWDQVYSVEHPHAFGKKGGLLKKIFTVGPFKTNGGRGVINNIGFRLNEEGIYVSHGGPSTRRVIDFSDVEKSVAILPTGQSGNLFSPFYKNQAEKYREGEFVPMHLNPKDYKYSENQLILLPKID